MFGVAVWPQMHCATVYLKLKCVLLQAGLVGQWWHGTPVRCQGNWQWMNSTEVGAESDLCLLVA